MPVMGLVRLQRALRGLTTPDSTHSTSAMRLRLGDTETGLRVTGATLTEAKAGNQSRPGEARKSLTSATTEGVSTIRENVSHPGEISGWRHCEGQPLQVGE